MSTNCRIAKRSMRIALRSAAACLGLLAMAPRAPLISSDAFGCTIVMAARDGLVLVGNNEDRNHPKTVVVFRPATDKYHGCVMFGYDDMPFQGGMNDQGLFIDANSLAPTGWKPEPGKPTFGMNPLMFILTTCATCKEVRAVFEKYNFTVLERARIPIADRTGASSVVIDLAQELKKGQRRLDLAAFFSAAN